MGIPGQHLLQPDIMLPAIVQIVFVEETLARPKWEIGKLNLLGIISEGNAALVRDAIILAVNVKPMEVGIAPAHSDLNDVMEVGNALVTAQQQPPPDHRANAA